MRHDRYAKGSPRSSDFREDPSGLSHRPLRAYLSSQRIGLIRTSSMTLPVVFVTVIRGNT